MRWIRVDPLADGGIQVSVHEDPLACLADQLDLREYPALSPSPVEFTMTVHGAADVPPGSAPAANAEGAALLWAERGVGANPNRRVNAAVDGWQHLSELRGHE